MCWVGSGVGLRSPFLYVAIIEVILRSIPVRSFSFSETKQGDRDASEYHPNHSHVDRGGSKTQPVGPQAAFCQHTLLMANWGSIEIPIGD